jgi:hypothetical protein
LRDIHEPHQALDAVEGCSAFIKEPPASIELRAR